MKQKNISMSYEHYTYSERLKIDFDKTFELSSELKSIGNIHAKHQLYVELTSIAYNKYCILKDHCL